MSESETYKELGALTRCKERWEECIPYVASLLTSDSVKIQAKALWMLGEMGLAFPEAITLNLQQPFQEPEVRDLECLVSRL